jgi:hypothetical protein
MTTEYDATALAMAIELEGAEPVEVARWDQLEAEVFDLASSLGIRRQDAGALLLAAAQIVGRTALSGEDAFGDLAIVGLRLLEV